MKTWLGCSTLVFAVSMTACGSGTSKKDAGRDVAGSSGGATGTGGAGAMAGTGGNDGTGGRAETGGAAGGGVSSGGSTSSGGAGGGTAGSTGGRGGASSTGGTSSTGGRGGMAGTGTGGGSTGGRGGSGSGGAASGGRGGGSGTGGGGGNQMCGTRTCATGEYCCNANCGLCAPMGAGCIQIACPADASILGDASACVAFPASDSQCSGATPHFYRCVLTELPAPCVVRSIGDVTNTYCCP